MNDGTWGRAEIAYEFEVDIADVPPDEDILFAAYECESYEGSAIVLFRRDGRLWIVEGGHCSCFGLEGQWEPDETTWETLQNTSKGKYLSEWSYDAEQRAKFAALLNDPPSLTSGDEG